MGMYACYPQEIKSAFNLYAVLVQSGHMCTTYKKGGKFPPLFYINLQYQAIPSLNFKDFKVFFISIVIVMGPTPPGTGVI